MGCAWHDRELRFATQFGARLSIQPGHVMVIAPNDQQCGRFDTRQGWPCKIRAPRDFLLAALL
jgi:hypothetical protein